LPELVKNARVVAVAGMAAAVVVAEVAVVNAAMAVLDGTKHYNFLMMRQ
jgi:hypothetical protein